MCLKMYPFRTSSYGKIGRMYPFCSSNTFVMINLDTIKVSRFFLFIGVQVPLFDIHAFKYLWAIMDSCAQIMAVN